MKYLTPRFFQRTSTLKLYWPLEFGSRSKTPKQNSTTVPTWDSYKDFPSEDLVKVPPAQDSIKLFPKLDVRNSSSLGLKQRPPRWDFSENSSSKLNQTLRNLHFSNSSNSGLEQRIPKWNFIESSSWRFDLLLPIPGFGYSLNSGLGQKHPEWNFTESSAWGSTKYFQSKTLSKKKLYLSSSGLKSNTSQVRFGCDSNSGAVLALILTSVNLFFLFSFSSF